MLDTGKIRSTSNSLLFKLPKELQKIPPASCDLYISSLTSPDYDGLWNDKSIGKLKKLLDQNCSITCNVDFVVANKIFTKSIQLRENLEMLNLNDVCKVDLKKYLLNNKLCCEDPGIVEKLKKLAEEAGKIFKIFMRDFH